MATPRSRGVEGRFQRRTPLSLPKGRKSLLSNKHTKRTPKDVVVEDTDNIWPSIKTPAHLGTSNHHGREITSPFSGASTKAGSQSTKLEEVSSSAYAPSSAADRQEQDLDALANSFLLKLQSRGVTPGAAGIDAATAKDLLTGFASVALKEEVSGSVSDLRQDPTSEWESEEDDCSPEPDVPSAEHDTDLSKADPREAVPDQDYLASLPPSYVKEPPQSMGVGIDQPTGAQLDSSGRAASTFATLEDPPVPSGIDLQGGHTVQLPQWIVLHSISCPDSRGSATFFDEPMLTKVDWDHSADHRWHWDARNRVSPARLRELHATGKPFIVTRQYDCRAIGHHRRSEDEDGYSSGESVSPPPSVQSRTSNIERNARSYSPDYRAERYRDPYEDDQSDIEPPYEHQASDPDGTIRENVYLVSSGLRRHISRLLDQHPWLKAYRELTNTKKGRLSAPYYFFYHFKKEMFRYAESIAETGEDHGEYEMLLRYLLDQTRSTHAEVEAHVQAKKVRAHLMPYFFKPGEILVATQDGQPVGRAQTSVLSADYRELLIAASEPGQSISFRVGISYYTFDGQYRLADDETTIRFNGLDGDSQSVRHLHIYPLRFATTKIQRLLISRGETFVKYCAKHYVTYSESQAHKPIPVNRSHDEDLLEQYQTQVRYMIDGEAFRMIHEDDHSKQPESGNPVVDAEPENHDFLCQLPAFVNGFHMVNKKWVPLMVENVQPIVWNKTAFNNLAAPDDTKMLITALITNKIKSTESMDFVQGKGTGLIVLLHGGPGTGKTLTAESVAEIAEKPLYRVSCGDIGTDSRQVEDYLTSVFYLGRRWESVVLLDEADVFLEERSLDNLQRNALVSVFLRMIEYFDGILVLTSNRVGTFDEAFKSRIQLSLHYENLDVDQRKQIWASFVTRLKQLKEGMEPDIERRIDELASYEMNGRQIRNAITSARQVSRYKGERLSFQSLDKVIKVGQRFETYLRDVRGHSSDEWARFEHQR